MGYTTQYEGAWTIAPPMTAIQVAEYRKMVDDECYPAGNPKYYCQWAVSDDGTKLQWDGGEKFYGGAEWLQFLIDKHFTPIGRTVFGEVLWQGEDLRDRGILSVVNGKVTATKDEDRKPADGTEGKFNFLVERIKTVILPALKENGAYDIEDELKSFLKKCGV